ncbi:hypothetical protein IAT38_005574 [Cryptococcus sp. DSM 104549]
MSLRALRCQLSLGGCDDEASNNMVGGKKRDLGERGGTVPGGQVLPDWLTYVDYTTTVDGVAITTGSVANLPLTYYGPSIPLGDGWEYGGLTSPAPSTANPTSSTPETSAEATTSVPGGSTGSTGTGSELATGLSSVSVSTAAAVSTTGSASSLQSASSSSVATSSSSSTTTPFSSSTSTSPTSTTSSSSSDIASSLGSSASTSTSTSTPLPAIPGRNLLTPLLAVFIPLGIALLIFLILLFIYRRRRQDRTVGFLPWLFSPKKWAPVPTTPRKKRTPTLPTTSPGVRSPNEKSALLPSGFVAQHHRNSSSISAITGVEADDEMRDLVHQNQSLLQRLTLGLGWITPNSAAGSGGSSSRSRRTSGNTLEKGERILSGAAAAVGLGKARSTTQTASSGNGQGYEPVLEDDQLFYKVPPQTQSSRGSRGSGAGTNSSSSRSGPSTRGSRWASSQPPLPEGAATPLRHFNVGIPETPGSKAMSERDMDIAEFGAGRSRWREGGDRMQFPVPPGLGLYGRDDGTFGPGESGNRVLGNRASMMTMASEFHSAHSHISMDPPTPPAGAPLHRDSSEYRHASVSAFGSHPPTPNRGSMSLDHATGSSHSMVSPISRQTSPFRGPSPVAPFGSPSPVGDRSGRAPDESIRPMKNLFALTPPASASSGSRVSEEKRRSYAGQPIIDEKKMKRGEGVGLRVGMGEFGEPLRPTMLSPTIVSPAQHSADHTSETGSIHTSHGHSVSSPSHYSHSQSSSSGHGSHVSAAAARDQAALRGKRSHAQLVRASRIAEQMPELPPLPKSPEGAGGAGSGDSNEVAQGGDEGRTEGREGGRTEGREGGRKGWFGWRG